MKTKSIHLLYVQIRKYLPVYEITCITTNKSMIVSYNVGAYRHKIEMTSLGDYREVTFRNGSLLEEVNKSANKIDDNAPEVKLQRSMREEGYYLNVVSTPFVVGAGNGLFGFGITKTERDNKTLINMTCYENGFFGLEIRADSHDVFTMKVDANDMSSTFNHFGETLGRMVALECSPVKVVSE